MFKLALVTVALAWGGSQPPPGGFGSQPPPPNDGGGGQPPPAVIHTLQEALTGFEYGPNGWTFFFDSDQDQSTPEISSTDDPVGGGVALAWLLTGTGDPPTTYTQRMRACYQEALTSCKKGVKSWKYEENTSSTGVTTSSCTVECN